MYTIGGATAQWYYHIAPYSKLSATGGSRVLLSLKHALTSSAGTNACGALVLTLVQIFRSLVASARRKNSGNILALICAAFGGFGP